MKILRVQMLMLKVLVLGLLLVVLPSCSSAEKTPINLSLNSEEGSENKASSDAELKAIALHYLRKKPSKNDQISFQFEQLKRDKYQTQHVKFTQWYKNVPIWASELIVHIKNKEAYRLTGNFVEIANDFSTAPAFSFSMIKKTLYPSEQKQVKGQLMILIDNAKPPKLAYRVERKSVLKRYVYFIDAKKGTLLKTVNVMPQMIERPD